jgi:hypothetical protein
MLQHWSFHHNLLNWLQLNFACSLHWNQHWRDGVVVMLLTSLGMQQKSWKGFHKMASRMFPTTLQSLAKVYSSTRGLFWKKCSLNCCTFLFLRNQVIVGTFWRYHVDTVCLLWCGKVLNICYMNFMHQRTNRMMRNISCSCVLDPVYKGDRLLISTAVNFTTVDCYYIFWV